ERVPERAWGDLGPAVAWTWVGRGAAPDTTLPDLLVRAETGSGEARVRVLGGGGADGLGRQQARGRGGKRTGLAAGGSCQGDNQQREGKAGEAGER
ncbi:hypothetical protein EA837_20275, partial [Klebsiella pneumoniae]